MKNKTIPKIKKKEKGRQVDRLGIVWVPIMDVLINLNSMI